MDWCYGGGDDSLTVPNLSQSSERLYAENGSPSSRSWFDWELERDDHSEKFFSRIMKGEETTNLGKDYKPVSCSQEHRSHEDSLFTDLPDHPLQGSLERIDFWDSGFFGETLLNLDKLSDSSDGDLSSAMFCDQMSYSLNNTCNRESQVCQERRGNQALRGMHESTRSLEAANMDLPRLTSTPAELQATVLQDFEEMLPQIDTKLRIRIRDALYRLAATSNHHHHHLRRDHHKSNKKCRSRGPGFKERETNAIDRAIANMMFTNSAYPRQW